MIHPDMTVQYNPLNLNLEMDFAKRSVRCIPHLRKKQSSTRMRKKNNERKTCLSLHSLFRPYSIHYLSCYSCILLLTYRSLNGSVPEYISSLLNISLSSRAGLRSSNSTNLTQLRTKSWGDRAFTAAAPRLWNSLPHSIKMSANQNVFQKQLQTYLMSEFLS